MGAAQPNGCCCLSREKGLEAPPPPLPPSHAIPQDTGEGCKASQDVSAPAAFAKEDPDTVTFEVQGEYFKVLTSTIRMQPDTLLGILLDTEEDLSKPIFVEGDKHLFGYILSWYRHASSMRIHIPLTVSKAAMEQACHTFGLPDGVQVVHDVDHSKLPEVIEGVKHWLRSKQRKAQKQRIAADDRLQKTVQDFDNAMQALEEDAGDYIVHVVYEALLRSASTSKVTMTPDGGHFEIDPHCWVELALPQCVCGWDNLLVSAKDTSIKKLLVGSDEVRNFRNAARMASHARRHNKRVDFSRAETCIQRLAAADGLHATVSVTDATTHCPVCYEKLTAACKSSSSSVSYLTNRGFAVCRHPALRMQLAAQ